MTRELRFSARIWPEVADAIVWHEEQRAGRGAEVATLLERVFEEIGLWPERWPFSTSGPPYRRRVLLPVPYVVFYVADENSVEIVALAHTSRRPGYWMP